ncbi:DsbA family protein [Azotobacter chroococcum]|uniref:DsbA family oxidoreductase n=1 Tax=Azotobacter chroococcum NCIMB 8003 TaxID=1328314 RepID=A0A0C4WT11_9GAMM|nr:thioredoxin domain-containing protein [Azotobacter chroococcum]AJE23851.1 DsbA family oxidoreductase [Azotobacter chroococcum NCIMB 8003]
MSSTSIRSTLLTTGLATALVVGGFYHFKLVGQCQSEMADLKNQLEMLTPAGIDTAAMTELIPSGEAGNTGNAVPDNWIYGAATARYTLVEMTDTECPYCREHFPLLKGLIDSSGGHINAALLHVPAHGEASRNQALAIECAGEQGGSEAAWKYAESVFQSTPSNGKGVSGSLTGLATALGLDGKRFASCLDSIEAVDRVRADLDQALKLGITQTPSTLVVDNESGQSLVLQGAHASRDGILQALEGLSGQRKGANHE